MDEKQFEKILTQADDLSPDQFKRLIHAYANGGGLDAGRIWSSTVYSVSEQKLAALSVNRACPGCGSVAVVHNGTNAAGIQRFHCQNCGKNFTHSPARFWRKAAFRGKYGRKSCGWY